MSDEGSRSAEAAWGVGIAIGVAMGAAFGAGFRPEREDDDVD